MADARALFTLAQQLSLIPQDRLSKARQVAQSMRPTDAAEHMAQALVTHGVLNDDQASQLLRAVEATGAPTVARGMHEMPASASPTDATDRSPMTGSELRHALGDENIVGPTLLKFVRMASIGSQMGEEPSVDLMGHTRIDAIENVAPKYYVGNVLGRGGMGEVCVATDRDLRREVAIKTLLRPDEPSIRTRFVEEAQITGQLEHPNIVPIHELGLDDTQTPFLVMKRVKGRSLKEVLGAVADGNPTGLDPNTFRATAQISASQTIDAGNSAELRKLKTGAAKSNRTKAKSRMKTRKTSGARMSSSQISDSFISETGEPVLLHVDENPQKAMTRLLTVYLKVCDAIAYAHSRGVIHRDLKPENVMVGEFGEVLVMDWGLSKVVGRKESHLDRLVITDRNDNPDDIARTLDGTIAGTPMYMPPEQALGKIDRLDERSDVFSLGALLYEILTLNTPYDAENVYNLLVKVERNDIEPIQTRTRAPWSIPRELESVVLTAMARRPEHRFQSVLELKEEIEAYLSGRTLASVDYSPLDLLVKWVKRNKVAVIGGATTALVAIAALVFIIVQANEAAHQQQLASVEADRQKDVAARKAEEAARLDAEDKRLVDLRRSADTAFGAAKRLMQEAERNAPFNPAAPQEFFQARLSAALELGRGLTTHPEPPDSQRSQLIGLCRELRDRAIEVGDWAIARHVVQSAEYWGAIKPAVSREWLAVVDSARQTSVEQDRARLDSMLTRIREAAARTEDQGGLQPGELQEHARTIARMDGAHITTDMLRRLDRGIEYTVIQRRFCIEVLGRRGDADATYAGTTAPGWLAAQLRAPRGGFLGEDIAAVMWAVARIEAQRPGTFDEFGGARSLIAAAARDGSTYSPEVLAKNDTDVFLDAALRGAALPSPELQPEAFDRILVELGDWAANSAASGTAYTARLLDLAGEDATVTTPDGEVPLGSREQVFVLDQLGLHGDARPPVVTEPDRNALYVLRGAFEAFPRTWVLSRAPADVEQDVWELRMERSVVSALNLTRFNDGWVAVPLIARRRANEQANPYRSRTQLAMRMARLDEWPDPTTHEEYFNRGAARGEAGDVDGAIEDLSAAITLDSEYDAAYSERAAMYVRLGDYARAVDDVTTALRLRPDDALLHNTRGVVLVEMGNWADAAVDFARAIELEPDTTYYTNRGACRRQLGDVDGAIEDYSEAIRLNPDFTNAFLNRGVLYHSCQAYDKAIADFSEAYRLDSANVNALVNRGIARKAMGDGEGAIEDFTRAIAQNPRIAAAYNQRGRLRLDIGDLAGAIEDYSEYIKLKPVDPIGFCNRGQALGRLGRVQDAVIDLRRAIALQPEYIAAYNVLTIIYNDAMQYARGVETATAGLGFAPDDVGLLLNRSVAYYRLRRMDEARADTSRAIELDDANSQAYSNRGAIHVALEKYDLAQADFERAIALGALSPDPYVNLMRVHALHERFEQGVAVATAGLQAFPNYAELQGTRGVLRLQLGELMTAMSDIGYALIQDPNNWWYWVHLGEVRAKCGDKDGAADALDKAFEVCPRDSEEQVLNHREMALAESGERERRPLADPAHAQPLVGTTIEPGRYRGKLAVDAVFQNNRYLNFVTFQGRAGQRVRITMRSDDVDSVTVLFGPNEQQFASSDDAFEGNFDAQVEVELDADGTWAIACTSSSPHATGVYTLEFEVVE